jgi:glutamine synthetase adenylyltransferase
LEERLTSPTPTQDASQFDARTFADPERAGRNWQAIRERVGENEVRFAAAARSPLAASADPDMALNNLERLLAATPDPVATADSLCRSTRDLDALLTLLAGSQFFSDVLVKRPQLWSFLLESGFSKTNCAPRWRRTSTTTRSSWRNYGKSDNARFSASVIAISCSAKRWRR